MFQLYRDDKFYWWRDMEYIARGSKATDMQHRIDKLLHLYISSWWKQGLNSDGQQFHQLQQQKNGQSALTWTDWTYKNKITT